MKVPTGKSPVHLRAEAGLCFDLGTNVGSAECENNPKPQPEAIGYVARSASRFTFQIRVSIEPPDILGDEHIRFLS